MILRYRTSLQEDLRKYDPINLHFEYLQLISMYYAKRDEEGNIDKCIHICLKDIALYPLFKQAYIKDDINNLKVSQSFREVGSKEHNELQSRIDNYQYPILSVPSFKRLAIIYEQQNKLNEAIEVCEKAISYSLDDGTKGGFEGRIEKLNRKITNPPAPARKKTPSNDNIKKNKLKMNAALQVVGKTRADDKDGFLVTFSKSSSNNFERALHLAKQSDEYEETEQNGNIIYQAYYKPENHLRFILLYELISNWKSTFVFKNGIIIDRKNISQINYCYGDKLRSADNNFCFGASMFTANPLGCHRLMIHESQKPWYKWIKGESDKYIFIDKEGMKEQIDQKAQTFKICPSFNYDNIIDNLNNLPNKIDKESDLYKKLYHSDPDGVLTVTVNINDMNNKQTNKSPKKQIKGNTGCGTLIALIPLTFIISIVSKMLM